MYIKIIATFLSVLLITSCGTTKLSKNEIYEVDAGRKAIVRADNVPLLAGMIFGEMPVLEIEAIDGKKIEVGRFSLNGQIAIDVGLHEIEFSCSDRAGKHKGHRAEIIQLDIKSHHEYLVDCGLEFDVRVKEKRVKSESRK